MLELVKKLFKKTDKEEPKIDLLSKAAKDAERFALEMQLYDKNVKALAMAFTKGNDVLEALQFDNLMNAVGLKELPALKESEAIVGKENEKLFKSPADMLKTITDMKQFKGIFDPDKKLPKPLEQARSRIAFAIFSKAAIQQRIAGLEQEYKLSQVKLATKKGLRRS